MEKILRKIWLSEKEAKIYLAGLSNWNLTSSQFAEKTWINRTSTYDILKSLSKKWLVHKGMKSTHTFFQVLNPTELISYLERNRREYEKKIEKEKKLIQENLIELKSLENPYNIKSKIKFFEWEKGIREACEDTLTSSEPIRAYANCETLNKALPNFFPEYYSRRKEKWISISAFLTNNKWTKKECKQNKKVDRKSILIDSKKYNFSPEVNFYDNKVLIISWNEKIAILIESKEIAECFKMMYDFSWENALKAGYKIS